MQGMKVVLRKKVIGKLRGCERECEGQGNRGAHTKAHG